jgi:hypothetical protein
MKRKIILIVALLIIIALPGKASQSILDRMELQEPSTPTVKLNPPHGQPDHRCDIQVSSPLDASAGSSSAPKVINRPMQPKNETSPANVGAPDKATSAKPTSPASPATEVRLNPPHGQPGHRCEIPVGSPLDAPAATPAAPKVNNSQAQPQSASPSANQAAPIDSWAPTKKNAARLNNTPVSSSTGQRLNPPHGQPGHRCDIPVGSPL